MVNEIMCGIVGGVLQQQPIKDILLNGLTLLEYRGYDSAGICLLTPSLKLCKSVGKVSALKEQAAPLANGSIGIAHTRWATHGPANERNAHPHISRETLSIVHNGIIENHAELKEKLKQKGYEFTSETDSEVIAHLISESAESNDFLSAVQHCVAELKGSFAIAAIHEDHPNTLIIAAKQSPLLIGIHSHGHLIASDLLALSQECSSYLCLHDGDVAKITHDKVELYNYEGKRVKRATHHIQGSYTPAQLGSHKHFMHKEIHEQPHLLEHQIKHHHTTLMNPSTDGIIKHQQIEIIACGSSYHSGVVGQYWLEQYARIPVKTHIASEYHYRNPVINPSALTLLISQSGETADTIAALKFLEPSKPKLIMSLCNVMQSSLARASDLTLPSLCGSEIGVAATKSFSAQLISLAFLTLLFTQKNKPLFAQLSNDIDALPDVLEKTLLLESNIKEFSQALDHADRIIYLGRHALYPIAMEGALKLKEITYIHAEAYAGGELKHGPLALIDDQCPTIALVHPGHIAKKMISNIEEILARNGPVLVVGPSSLALPKHENLSHLVIPDVSTFMAPVVYSVVLQLLAYHVALRKGLDIDKPRNLAKCVTVE